MFNVYFIVRIAFYEARLIFRSWGFRIFSGLALAILALLNFAFSSPNLFNPYYFSSLSGSLPLNSLKLFNIFQGIIVAFMATEFFKRDRRYDSVQVVFARSFSNVEYFIGKALGVFSVFFLLNVAVLVITFIFHYFVSNSPFALQPYLLYMGLISLPTLIFMIGLSFFLSCLLRSQAMVFLVLLAFSFLVLVFFATALFGLCDVYAFFTPLMYSDFIGLGNTQIVLSLRLFYLFLGLSLIFVSPLLFKRLRQSAITNIVTGVLSAGCLVLAIFLAFTYTNTHAAARRFREQIRTSSEKFRTEPTATVQDCDIQFEYEGDQVRAVVVLNLRNDNSQPLSTLFLTLNPGLSVQSVTQNQGDLAFVQDNHILHITPIQPVDPGSAIAINISYSGKIDERYCFLDIDNTRYEGHYRLWLYDIPKKYAVVTSDYVHLTPESGWYPVAGLSAGAAYPAMIPPDFSKYTLTVTVPNGLTAISQGKPEQKSQGTDTLFTFSTEQPLPKISLTIGTYEQRTIDVDNVSYSLYIRPGHSYFDPLLNEIGDQLPELIKQLRNEYEVMLGMDYPYARYTLVEVPIQIYGYQRLWTTAHETVQPQITFLPEMGTLCTMAELRMPARQAQRMGQGRTATPAQIQRNLLNRFFRSNLMAPQANARNTMRRNRLGLRLQADIEPQYDIFPNFFSFVTQIASKQWPVLNLAFESYMRERVAPPMAMFRQAERGLSLDEETNMDLKGRSLRDILENPEMEASVIQAAIQAKNRVLLARLEAEYAGEDFSNKILDFLKDRKYTVITENDLADFFAGLGQMDFQSISDDWYNRTQIPAFILGNVESYDVIEGEQTRTQIKFLLANPTSVDGVTRISLRSRGRGGRDMPARGQGDADYTRSLLVPAGTTLELGIVADTPPAGMSIDTFVSQNIPASVTQQFMGQREEKDVDLFEDVRQKPFEPSDFSPEGEYIVDNGDPGFEIQSTARPNWLSRTLQKLFKVNNRPQGFRGVNIFNPPVFWTLSTSPDYYGQFVRSAYVKKAGEGEDKIIWHVELADTGEYDIYFFNGISGRMGRGMMEMRVQMAQSNESNPRGRMRRFFRGPGKKYFIVPHQYGTEEVEIDLESAESGWVLIGNFQLDAGPNLVELTDKNEAGYVLADSVKWVKR